MPVRSMSDDTHPIIISIYPLPFDELTDMMAWNKTTFGEPGEKWKAGFGYVKFAKQEYANWFRLRWDDTIYEYRNKDDT